MSGFESIQTNEQRWKLLRYRILEEQIAELFNKFREEGIEPVLIKGWAAGLFYPVRFERVFSDFDLAVDPSDFEKARTFVNKNNLTVDLHCGLDRLDTLDWDDIFLNTQLKNIGDTPIRILRPEDHLRVLCTHWLADGGVFKEKLLDIYYLIENRDESFDWARCLDTVSRKRRDWIIKTIAIVEKYFGLNRSSLPFRDELENIPAWMIKTLEKEWRENIPLRPLQTCLKDWKELKKQIFKRIPPNPIQATIGCDGEFDESTRLKYQLLNLVMRVSPSFRRIFKTMRTGKEY